MVRRTPKVAIELPGYDERTYCTQTQVMDNGPQTKGGNLCCLLRHAKKWTVYVAQSDSGIGMQRAEQSIT